jgi:hypothetical protein
VPAPDLLRDTYRPPDLGILSGGTMSGRKEPSMGRTSTGMFTTRSPVWRNRVMDGVLTVMGAKSRTVMVSARFHAEDRCVPEVET